MSDIKTSYKKLNGSAFLSSNRLYIGQDHLLSIHNNFFSEEYLRFYYKDIQSIITRKTSRGKILNICFSIVLILFLFFAAILAGGWSVFFFVLVAIGLIPFFINILKGPTSISHIQTPIQTAKLSAIRRIRSSEKALAQLIPLVENTQGVLNKGLFEGINQHEESKASYKTHYKILKHENGIFHLILFSLLVLSSALIIVDIFYQNLILSLIGNAVIMSIAVLLIISLVKQKNSDLYKSIKTMAWSTIGYLCIITVFSYVISFIVTIQNQETINSQWELIEKISGISPLSNPWLLGLSIFSFVFSFVIGISGIVLTAKFRKEYESMQGIHRSVKEDSIPRELENE